MELRRCQSQEVEDVEDGATKREVKPIPKHKWVECHAGCHSFTVHGTVLASRDLRYCQSRNVVIRPECRKVVDGD